MREWCWFKTFWHSLKSFIQTGNWTPIMGHEYTPTEDWDVLVRVQVARCSQCGKYSVGWYYENQVAGESGD